MTDSAPDVFAVHVSKPDDIGAVEIVFFDEQEARSYAADRSTDYRVTAASVTRYQVGRLGTRRSVGWFKDGHEQERDWRRAQVYPSG